LVILDYSLGNLMSISKAFETLTLPPIISREEKTVRAADALILPGVGAFEDAMKNIEPIKVIILDAIKSGKPTLGICLGLQMLFTESTEGGLRPGLDIWKGRVDKLPNIVKVPQIGWNALKIKKSNPLIDGVKDGSYVYFVHSYYGKPLNKNLVVAETEYGVTIPSILSERNIYATQFHPEKSGKIGLKMLSNFIKIVRR
jgi:glutamine amidotransferase